MPFHVESMREGIVSGLRSTRSFNICKHFKLLQGKHTGHQNVDSERSLRNWTNAIKITVPVTCLYTTWASFSYKRWVKIWPWRESSSNYWEELHNGIWVACDVCVCVCLCLCVCYASCLNCATIRFHFSSFYERQEGNKMFVKKNMAIMSFLQHSHYLPPFLLPPTLFVMQVFRRVYNTLLSPSSTFLQRYEERLHMKLTDMLSLVLLSLLLILSSSVPLCTDALPSWWPSSHSQIDIPPVSSLADDKMKNFQLFPFSWEMGGGRALFVCGISDILDGGSQELLL